MPFVKMDRVSMKYHSLEGEIEALRDISFGVDKGEFVSIVGPSGCGKSTILSLISGLLKPTAGRIYVKNQEVTGNLPYIGYMLQKDHLFEWRTIFENVLIGLEIRNMANKESIAYVERLLDAYGLSEFKDCYPSQLSGGMRQRAALARTLATEPEILLLDEPFSALDYQTRLAIADEIGSILRKENKTAILVTHDIAEAISMSDRVIVLSKRPAFIKTVYPIELTCETRRPMCCREAPEFRIYFNKIWKELDVHV